jgi:hypothetical protein
VSAEIPFVVVIVTGTHRFAYLAVILCVCGAAVSFIAAAILLYFRRDNWLYILFSLALFIFCAWPSF